MNLTAVAFIWFPFLVPFAMFILEVTHHTADIQMLREYLRRRCNSTCSTDFDTFCSEVEEQEQDVDNPRSNFLSTSGNNLSMRAQEPKPVTVTEIFRIYMDIHDQASKISSTFAVVIAMQLFTLMISTVVSAWDMATTISGSAFSDYMVLSICILVLTLTMIFRTLWRHERRFWFWFWSFCRSGPVGPPRSRPNGGPSCDGDAGSGPAASE